MNAIIFNSLLTLATTASQPTFVRVAVVDNSPSMQGERIEAVRRELLGIIRQMPPSPDCPLVLIVFHGTVEPTNILTDAPSAEAVVSGLRGDGTGTRIAPGLMRACDELQPYRQASNVLVMLFTDGEDGDRQGILAAEARLDALFAQRSRQGLGQTVFVQRWGNANAELINRFRASGNVQVLDAGELNIESLTVDPSANFVSAHRDTHDPHLLHITYSPALAVRGGASLATRVSVEFACITVGAKGQSRMRVQAGAMKLQYTLTVPIPPDAEKTGRLELLFRVQPIPDSTQGKSFVLPLLPTSIVIVPVPLPLLAACNRATAAIRQIKAIGWVDPLALRARYQVQLELTVTAGEPSAGIDRATTFRVAPSAGVRMAGTDTLSIAGPGTYDVPLEIELSLAPVSSKSPTINFALELHPVRKAVNLRYDPPIIRVQHDVPAAPARATTTLTPIVKRLSVPVWYDLYEPLVAFDADVALRVDGAIPHQTTLTLVCPGNVRNQVLPPNTQVHSGETIVTLRVVARVDPGKQSRLDFSIVPPAPTSALNFHVVRGFSLTVVAPPAVQLLNATRTTPTAVLRVGTADNQELLDLTMVPVLAGADLRRVQRLPRVTARVLQRDVRAAAGAAAASSTLPLQLRLPIPMNRPFFFDIEQRIDVELQCDKPAAAVRNGRVQVLITRQAPFKRLLVYLVWTVFPLGVLGLAARVVRRLREPVAV